LIIGQVEEVLVEARSRDIQLDDGDYFKIIIALCQNKMAAQAQVPYLSPTPEDFGKILRYRIWCLFDSWILVCFLRIPDPIHRVLLTRNLFGLKIPKFVLI
jgi:hypothetical protein